MALLMYTTKNDPIQNQCVNAVLEPSQDLYLRPKPAFLTGMTGLGMTKHVSSGDQARTSREKAQ